MSGCNTPTCQIDGKANPANPDGSPYIRSAPSLVAARSGRGAARSGRPAPRAGCAGGSSPDHASGMSIPFNPGQPGSPPDAYNVPARLPPPSTAMFTPQTPPPPSMDTGLAKVPVDLYGGRGPTGQTVGFVPPPTPPFVPPLPVKVPPPVVPDKVPPSLTADVPKGDAQAQPAPLPLPSVKDLCARYPELATTVLCRRDSEGTLNLAPECLATLRDGLAAGLTVAALRAHERCTSFAELLVPASAPADSSLAMTSPMLADAAAVKSAGAVADACYTHFLGLSTDAQARILEDGSQGAYAVCQQAAAMIRRGQTAAARVAADWLYAHFARTSPVLADFCAAVANAAGLRPAGYVTFSPRPSAMVPAARMPTYSLREWPRPAGDPPAADMSFTLAETQTPDPWAGLAGGGLGPAYNPTTGQTFNPVTGQAIQPAAPSPDYSAALTGLGAGATALVGGYLRGEQATQIAASQAQATTTAALAQAQALRDVATINANRDLAIAQLRGTSDPGAQAALQAQINALGTALSTAQSNLASAACPGNVARLGDGTCPAPAADNTALYVVGGVVALGVVGGLAYALSGSSGRKHNGRGRVKRPRAGRNGRRAAARGR